MKSDVFLAATRTDRSRADLIARRLRAVKLKVRFDKARDHATPSAKDQRDLNEADQVLVLWSAAACDPNDPDCDWMYAVARSARARGVLVQASLDGTRPGDPFDEADPFRFDGLTTRTLPDDLLRLVDTFGARQGRSDLSGWLALATRDQAGREAWMAAHPDDPIAKAARRKATGKAATGATTSAPESRAGAGQSGAAEAATASPPAGSAAPPLAQRPPRERVAARPNVTLRPAPATPPPRERSTPLTLGTIGVAIAAFFVLAAVLGEAERAPPSEEGAPAIGNAAFPLPLRGGRDPAREVLEPGPILNDTGPAQADPPSLQGDDGGPPGERSGDGDRPAPGEPEP